MSDEKSPSEAMPEASDGVTQSTAGDDHIEHAAQVPDAGVPEAQAPEFRAAATLDAATGEADGIEPAGRGGPDAEGTPSLEANPATAVPAEHAPSPGQPSQPDHPSTTGADPGPSKPSGGPINLDRIRELRKNQQRSFPPIKKPSPSGQKNAEQPQSSSPKAEHSPLAKKKRGEEGVIKTPAPPTVAPKVSVPSRREGLSPDLEDELAAALGESGNLDSLLVGDSSLQVGIGLTEGQRIQGKIMKARGEHVFVSLGGPNEGVLAATQFEETPAIGSQIEVVVRGFLSDEGLYELTLPGSAIEVNDWDDLREGEVIEVLVTGSNSGGLECKAGAVQGFIPASQVAEYRVENLADMVDQKVLCVITEANPRRGNLVLSRRAVLEREKREKREERLAALQIGDAVEGTVSRILDFGAFVDIGGLDGLLHISQLSWERVEHPSEILEEGQKIQVRIDKIDPQTGKIGLSYRSLQEHPWTDISTRFPVGSLVKGNVTRIAEFGAFVKIATGVEGLVHLSELAHHRVHRVSNVVQEGQEIEVKVLSIEEDNQRISLSLKAAQAAPAQEAADERESGVEEPPAKPVLPKHEGPLKGGMKRKTGGEEFGLKW